MIISYLLRVVAFQLRAAGAAPTSGLSRRLSPRRDEVAKPEARNDGTVAEGDAKRPHEAWWRKFNIRVALVRVPVNAAAVALTAFVLSGVHVTTSRPVIGYLIIGAVFGLLNAFVKPVLQYVALPLLLESFGLVVILVDVLVFWLLDKLFPRVIHVDGFWWMLAGGALLGFLSFLFDNLFGLTQPIVDDRPESRPGVAA
jgi:putative membrane protein